MAIHNYTCAHCGETFEYFSLGSSDPARCPQCDSDQVERQMVSRMSLAGMRRHGSLVDMSSGSCPCGCNGRHAH